MFTARPKATSVLAVAVLGLLCARLPRDASGQVPAVSLPVGGNPGPIAVNPTTNKIYVETANNNLAVIDGATGSSTTLAIGVQGSIAVNPVTNKIYVSNGPFAGIVAPAELAVIEGGSNSVSIIAPGSAGPIAVNPVTNTIYVVNEDSVTAINGNTNAATTISVGVEPTAIGINPVTNRVYVSSATHGYLAVIDGSTNTTVATLEPALGGAVAVDPVTNKIFVVGIFTQAVLVVDGTTNAMSTVSVGTDPGPIAVNAVTGKVYVGNLVGSTLTVIDEATMTPSTIPVGIDADHILINPVTNQVYLEGVDPRTAPLVQFEVLDGNTSAVTPLPTGTQPQYFALNPVTGTLYISNNGSADVTVVAAPPPIRVEPAGRLVNLSARALVGTGANALLPGFVIRGEGMESLLIRAVGPGLTPFGVSGVLAEPSLRVYDPSGSLIVSNTGWATGPNPAQVANTAAQVGAFPLAAGSADCAVLVTLPAGAYTVQVAGLGGGTGIALAEVYEVAHQETRLVNLGTRAQTGAADTLIEGFVVGGSGPETLLIRGDGPGLRAFGVGNALAAPDLTVMDGAGGVVAANSGWSAADPGTIEGFEAELGAFSLALGSADCAQVVALAPGAYTAQIDSADGSSGVALAEIFESP